MNLDDFNKLLERRIKLTKDVLMSKSAEYSTKEDKLHNFKRAAQVADCSPEQALFGMYLKHLVSVLDIIEAVDIMHKEISGKSLTPEEVNKVNKVKTFTKELIEEKIGDSINYHILLEALLKETLGVDK